MRKEEEPMAKPTRVAMAAAEEVELTDEQLLGEATLAKITVRTTTTVLDEEQPEGEPDLEDSWEVDTEDDDLTVDFVEEIVAEDDQAEE
jgi:hypothetical protein